MRSWLFVIIYLSLSVSLSAQYSTPEKIKKYYINLCQKYYPDGIASLNYEKDISEFKRFVDGYTENDLLEDFNTVTHEMYHGYESAICSENYKCNGYFLGGDIRIPTMIGKVFKTPEMDKAIPDSFKNPEMIFRYNPYVVGSLNISSHTEGIYGLFEEMNAYWVGMHATLCIWPYIKEKAGTDFRSEKYKDFFQNVSGDGVARYEFRFFIAWYLEYAKAHYPDVYAGIMQNTHLRLAYTLLEMRFDQAEKTYQACLTEYVSSAKESGLDIELDEEGELWIYNPDGSGSGWVLNNMTVERLKNAYLPKWEKLIEEFKLPNANFDNWESFM